MSVAGRRVQFEYEGAVTLSEQEGGFCASSIVLEDLGWDASLDRKLGEVFGVMVGCDPAFAVGSLGRLRIVVESV